ncbi:MAG: OstA-like protein, partial [Flavobacteriales bacterium]
MSNAPYKAVQLLALTASLLLIATAGSAQKAKKIKILKANSLIGDETKGMRKLIGDVGFEHEGVQLFCDSAYLFSKQNNINAYGHVHIRQGDTLNMYGDSLVYNGNERIARLRHNIRVVDNEMTLTTDYLDYDRNLELAYYMGGGEIVNGKQNTRLKSVYGYYYPRTKSMHYKQNVELTTPQYKILSDTLIYNTASEITYFIGPSDITGKENHIYCENGWYNTRTDRAQFSQNARIESGSKTLTADSIF